jgi:hypothetical protein
MPIGIIATEIIATEIVATEIIDTGITMGSQQGFHH